MHALVLEVGEREAGVLVADDHGFTLYVALPELAPLERRHFRTVRSAMKAAEAILRPYPAKPSGIRPQRDRREASA